MYRNGGTIRDTIEKIKQEDFVLPAIQREFVWSPEKIYGLFDSLMQRYPFGAFLYWTVKPETTAGLNFYGFVKDYHEKNNPHCPELSDIHEGKTLTAVLDGQQRLTALNIGLRGSMAWKAKNKWRNNPDAFPVRHLYLNLFPSKNADNEETKYEFEFLTEADYSARAENGCWFKVGEILKMAKAPEMLKWLNQEAPHLSGATQDEAFETLDRLSDVVNSDNKFISYYQEEDQDLDKVLNIFIRTNSGGTPLSHSDLLLSMAVAQWDNLDARKEIHDLVDNLNDIGGTAAFDFSKDFVLKSGLMMIGSDVGFNAKNFSDSKNMKNLEANWEMIKKALSLSVRLMSSFGFSRDNLSANSAVIPVAYYLYKKAAKDDYVEKPEFRMDRKVIRHWLIATLLKSGIWGSGLDSFLTALRGVIDENGFDNFPIKAIKSEMSRRAKGLDFSDEEINDLVDTQYKDKKAFPLMSLLFDFVDLNNNFHMDHIFPKSRFTEKRLEDAGVPKEKIPVYRDIFNNLANLQLLPGVLNQEKWSKAPLEWLTELHKDNDAGLKHHIEIHKLGVIPESIVDFDEFYGARREQLKSAINNLLNAG